MPGAYHQAHEEELSCPVPTGQQFLFVLVWKEFQVDLVKQQQVSQRDGKVNSALGDFSVYSQAYRMQLTYLAKGFRHKSRVGNFCIVKRDEACGKCLKACEYEASVAGKHLCLIK